MRGRATNTIAIVLKLKIIHWALTKPFKPSEYTLGVPSALVLKVHKKTSRGTLKIRKKLVL
jgi:hypothetical protein